MTDPDILKNSKILVIDDEKVIRENIKAFLEDMDFEVHTAENGRVGIDLFNKINPDIVLVHLRMPELGGLEVIRFVSDKDNKIPVIVISGTGLLQDAIEAIRRGAWDYLMKPIIDMNAVLHVVRNSLEKSRLMKENEEYRDNLENQVRERTLELELEIKARKNTEKLLRESQELLSSIIGNIPGATYRAKIISDSFEIEFISDVISQITGYNSEEFISDRGLYNKVFKSDELNSPDEMIKALNNKDSFFREYRITRKDGIDVWISERGQGVYDDSGNLLFVAGSIFDVTNEKKAERDLKIAFEKMEKADRLKTEFLANMSHEIRTPMTSIIGFSDLLSHTELSEEQNEFLNVIKRSSSHLLVIINDIIDIAKIESDQIEINNSPVDLYDILNDLNIIFRKRIQESGKKIDFKVKEVERERFVFLTDFVRVKQILMNIISNALKFTEEGYINIDYKILGDRLRFSVKDTGIGIPEDKGDEIFEKFTQADASFTRKYGGVGLGLAISRKLCSYLGGDLKYNSVLGEGSEFFFEIPFRTEMRFEREQQEVSGKKDDPGNKETILIVEDTRENILFLKAFLVRANYNVIFATNGLEACELYKSNKDISIVLMDVQMPVMDGMEAIKIIRDYENITGVRKPVIALTAHAMAGDEARFIEAGFSDYVAKPFRINEMLEKITKYV